MKSCSTCGGMFDPRVTFCPHDATPLLEVGHIGSGTVLRGKYRLLSEVGRGGMGVVWRALHLAWNEERAIKILRERGPDLTRAFMAEAKLTRHLRHHGIVAVEDVDTTEGGDLFVVMELVNGESLSARLKRTILPWRTAFAIVAETCTALEHAHNNGVIHRDIKPQNILLARDEQGNDIPKLIDFGIATIREGAQLDISGLLTSPTGSFLGTPEYASPEQAMGVSARTLDRRSDLYSLGLVLYVAVTGSLPFAAETPVGLLLQRLQQEPDPPNAGGRSLDIPEDASQVIMRALRKDATERYSSAAQMRSALLAALSDNKALLRSALGEPRDGERVQKPPTSSITSKDDAHPVCSECQQHIVAEYHYRNSVIVCSACRRRMERARRIKRAISYGSVVVVASVVLVISVLFRLSGWLVGALLVLVVGIWRRWSYNPREAGFTGPLRLGDPNESSRVLTLRGEDIEHEVFISRKQAAHGGEVRVNLPTSGRQLQVSVPAGVQEGTKLRFAGEGWPAPKGGRAGDLYVKVLIDERGERHA